ncbi:MAG: AAA family ATPase [Anaerolineae bacterium]
MIPLRLRLRNFMCYRELENLDFSGIHLACLAGANGHGKSALLDAMTWALWGKARAKSDEELIHQGQAEMEVDFEFELSENRYKVIRTCAFRRKSAHTQLYFHVWGGSRFRSMNEPSQRATQDKINRTLRLDYETFINSAFLRQGRADEFTVKRPAERKQILGEIMGLGIYDACEEQAKECAKAKEQEISEVKARIEEMERELAHRPEYERELKEVQAEVERLSAALRQAEEEFRSLRQKAAALEEKQKQISELEKRLSEAQEELREVEGAIEASRKRLAEYEATLEKRATIEEGFNALKVARQLKERLDAKRLELAGLNERKAALEGRIEAARQRLNAEREALAGKIAELETKAREIPNLEAGLAEARREIERIARLENEREARREESQALAEEMSALKAYNEQIEAALPSLQEKLHMLEGAEARCPLCGRRLTEPDRNRLIAQFTDERKEKEETGQANTTRLKELSDRREALERELAALEEELAKGKEWQRQEATLLRSLAEASRACEELASRKEELAASDERLARGDYAPQEREEMAALFCQIEELGYDPAEHEQVRQDIEKLTVFEKLMAELRDASDRAPEERNNLARLQASRERWQERIQADSEQAEKLRGEVAELPDLRRHLEEKGAQVESLEKAESHARQLLGAAQQKIETCERLAAEREQKLKQKDKLAEEKAIYEELRTAFGKKGVQAMLIESAIPEIEQEANALLARMTDNRLHVRFETQKEIKSGETRETLDIKISDELGTRNYEMYSGGEAFRINFAIRIALSKLLARRAGARLQTLVIDEGFGTQDAEGRERLVEAINSIRDDFEKILVITHIEELKDAFPVRINVFKTPQGSQVYLS